MSAVVENQRTTTAYENIISFYSSVAEKYNWTIEEIDNTNLEFMLDMLVTKSKEIDAEVRMQQIKEEQEAEKMLGI